VNRQKGEGAGKHFVQHYGKPACLLSYLVNRTISENKYKKLGLVNTSKNGLEMNLNEAWVYVSTTKNDVIIHMNDDDGQLTGLESFDLLPCPSPPIE